MPAATRVMIARYENGTQTLLPFTADLAKARQTLEAAALTPSPRQLLGDQDRTYVLDAIQSDAETGPCLYGDELARTYSGRKQDEVLSTLAALDRLVGTLDGLAGRKAVLYVSNGVPLRPGEMPGKPIDYAAAAAARAGAVAGPTPPMFGQARGPRPHPQKLRLEGAPSTPPRAGRRSRRAPTGQGVSLYSWCPRTAAQNGRSTRTCMAPLSSRCPATRRNQADAIFFLSSRVTGARSIQRAGWGEPSCHGRRPRPLLPGVSGTRSREPGVHGLRVEVNRPGVTLRHRRSYALKSRGSRRPTAS